MNKQQAKLEGVVSAVSSPPPADLVHFRFKIGYLVATILMIFTEIVPTREILTIIEKIFLVFSSVAVGLFLEWA